MRNNTRFFSAVVVLGLVVGVGLAANGAVAQPGDPEAAVEVTSTHRDSAEVEAELKAFWDEVARTGLMPIGVNAAGDGPFGWVEADKAVVDAGKPHGDLRVYDAGGKHIGWVVHGLTPMSDAAYQADPAGLRAAGLDRLAEFSGQPAE